MPFPVSLDIGVTLVEINLRVVALLVLASPDSHSFSVLGHEAELSRFGIGLPLQHLAPAKPRIRLSQHLPTKHLAPPVFEQFINDFMQFVHPPA